MKAKNGEKGEQQKHLLTFLNEYIILHKHKQHLIEYNNETGISYLISQLI